MWTDEETVAAGHSFDPGRWREAFEGLTGRIAGRFTRVEPRRRAGRLVLGLLSDLPRKNCWTIAERAGEAGPHGRLFLTLVVRPVRDAAHRLAWSDGRRHQARSRASHYRRQATSRRGDHDLRLEYALILREGPRQRG